MICFFLQSMMGSCAITSSPFLLVHLALVDLGSLVHMVVKQGWEKGQGTGGDMSG